MNNLPIEPLPSVIQSTKALKKMKITYDNLCVQQPRSHSLPPHSCPLVEACHRTLNGTH